MEVAEYSVAGETTVVVYCKTGIIITDEYNHLCSSAETG